jgi:hypothetical protein
VDSAVDAVDAVEAEVMEASLKAGETVSLRVGSKSTCTTLSRIWSSDERKPGFADRTNCLIALVAEAGKGDRTGELMAEAAAVAPRNEVGEGIDRITGEESGDVGSW